MRVGYGDSKRVGLILRYLPTGGEECFDHHTNLCFGGVACADDGFFDRVGGIFGAFEVI
jgi:hypothetical protein